MITCTPPDVCQCEQCAPPGTFPDGPPEREDHVAIRFKQRHYKHRAFLNGEEVSNQTTEACPGFRGYIVAYTKNAQGSFHRCRTCYRGACMRVVIGQVEVQVGV